MEAPDEIGVKTLFTVYMLVSTKVKQNCLKIFPTFFGRKYFPSSASCAD
jgi:hypothetical protein